jgi:hypothetical protein
MFPNWNHRGWPDSHFSKLPLRMFKVFEFCIPATVAKLTVCQPDIRLNLDWDKPGRARGALITEARSDYFLCAWEKAQWKHESSAT